MFIALGFLRTLHAEELVLESILRRNRAARTDTFHRFINAHEAPVSYTHLTLPTNREV